MPSGIVMYDAPQGGKYRYLTEKQKAKEDELFGPFAALGRSAAEQGGAYLTVNKMFTQEYPFWTVITEAGSADKCTVEVFKQFLHWAAMQHLSDLGGPHWELIKSHFLMLTNYGRSESPLSEEEVLDQVFTLVAEIIDGTVPDLAGDFFRVIDINDDGTISEEEWKKMRELIAQPSPPNLIKMLFKMMDKDNSKTLEQGEVCEFTKKLVNIIIRNIKNSVHILVKAVSAVLGSKAADTIFEILDKDRDGKLSPEECTMNFAGPMLMAVQSLAAAAPFLNEVRAKDHEIAFLKARLASLGGDMSDFAPLALPEIEISQDEYDDLVLICSKGVHHTNFHVISHEKSSGMRAALSKIMQMVSKLLARTFIKLTQFTMAESHDPESFFKAFKVMFTENMMELKGLLAPLYKVMPRGDRVIAITDKIHAKIQSGDFDKEIRNYSSSLFKMLDQDDDGKICPADAAIYTDLFFAPCLGDESAKKKFMAIFNNLDLAKSGSLSKDEISAFVTKFVNAYACAILVALSFIDTAIIEQADHEIKAMMEAYVKYAKERKFREVSTFDISEINALITEPYWLEYYVWSIAPSAEPARVRERFEQKYEMPWYS